jgi:hypothetical protein
MEGKVNPQLRTNNPYGHVTLHPADLSTPPVSPRPLRDEPSRDLSVGPSLSPQATSSSPQPGRGIYGQGIVETPSTPRHRIVPNNSQFRSPGAGFMSAAQNATILHHHVVDPSPHLSPSPMNPSPSPHLQIPPYNYMPAGRTPTPGQRPGPQPSTPQIRVGGAPVSQQSYPAAALAYPNVQHRASSTPLQTTTSIATSFPKQPCPSPSPLPKPAHAPKTTVSVQVGFRPPQMPPQNQFTPGAPQGLGSFAPTATVTVGARPPATPPRHASTPIVQVGTSGSKRAPNSSFPSYTGEPASVPEHSLSLSISAVENFSMESPFHPPPPVATAAPATQSPHSQTQSPKPSPVAAVPSTPPNEKKKKKAKKTPKSSDKPKGAAAPRNESPECSIVGEEKNPDAPATPLPDPQQQSAKHETPHAKKGNRSTPESKKTTPGKTPPSRIKKQRLPPSNRASPNSQLVSEAQRSPEGDEPVNATLEAVSVLLPQVDHVRNYYSLRHPTSGETYPATDHMVSQRLKQLLFGRNTPGYQNYRNAVARGLREHGNPDHPVTPRAIAKISKRRFDDICSEWRRTLHQWDHSPIGSRSQGLPTLIDLGLEPESAREISFDDPQGAADYANLRSPLRGTADGTSKENAPVAVEVIPENALTQKPASPTPAASPLEAPTSDDQSEVAGEKDTLAPVELPSNALPQEPVLPTPGTTLSGTPASDNEPEAGVEGEDPAAAASELGLIAEMSVVQHPSPDEGLLEDDLQLELQTMIQPSH